jgi:hypothetical protein
MLSNDGHNFMSRSPYIGERFGENGVGGKWLMGAVLRITLTLSGRGQGALEGEIISLNCCKWLQINRLFFRLLYFTRVSVLLVFWGIVGNSK